MHEWLSLKTLWNCMGFTQLIIVLYKIEEIYRVFKSDLLIVNLYSLKTNGQKVFDFFSVCWLNTTIFSCKISVVSNWLLKVSITLNKTTVFEARSFFSGISLKKLSLSASHFQTNWPRTHWLVSNKRLLFLHPKPTNYLSIETSFKVLDQLV